MDELTIATEALEQHSPRLEMCRNDGEILGLEDLCPDYWFITQAIKKFKKLTHMKKPIREWHKKAEADKDWMTWTTLKSFFKEECCNADEGEVDRVGALSAEVASLSAQLAERDDAFRQHEDDVIQALQSQLAEHHCGSDDSSAISTLTEAMELRFYSMKARINTAIDGLNLSVPGSATTSSLLRPRSYNSRGNVVQQLSRFTGKGHKTCTPRFKPMEAQKEQAHAKQPTGYQDVNEGRSLQCVWHCWKCGVAYTHCAAHCCWIMDDQRKQCAGATFGTQMGGSAKHLDRVGKHQSETVPAFSSL